MQGNRTITTVERFWSKVDRNGEHWLWRGAGATVAAGYGVFWAEGRRRVGAHSFALEMASGVPLPDGFWTLHTCDIPGCVRNDEVGTYTVNGIVRPRYGHLWLGTAADNHADMHAKGRGAIGARNGSVLHPDRVPRGDRHGFNLHPEAVPRGEQNGRATLTEDIVREIRRRTAAGPINQAALARDLGVGHRTLNRIVLRQSWKHV